MIHAAAFLVALVMSVSGDTATDRHMSGAPSHPLQDRLRMLGATHTLVSNDIATFMRPIREHGYNAVMVHGLDDEWGATYPSEIFPFAHHRNFKEETLKEIIEVCHHEGVRVIVYLPWFMFTDDPRFLDGDSKKATSSIETPTGTITTESAKGVTSFDSPFRHLLVAASKEIAALGADGLWVDGFTMENYNRVGGHFTHGAARFKHEMGLDWPEKEDWDSDTFRRWVKWRYAHHLSNGQWFVDQVHADYPEVSITFNTHFTTPMVRDPDDSPAGGPVTWHRWREAVPLLRFPPSLGVSNHARLASSNLSQSTPFWLCLLSDINPTHSDLWQPTFAERFHVGVYWHAYGSPQMNIQADELGLKMSALAAFTYQSQIWCEGNIRDGYGTNLAMYTRINDAIKAREAYFGGERVPYVGVYLSNNTRDYWGLRYRREDDPRNTDRLFTESYFGLVALLMSEHIQFSHIFDNMLDAATLDRFPVVLLPNVACLSEADCRALERYVTNGGRLIATFETSLYDEWGEPRKNFGLAHLLGIEYEQTLNKLDREPPMWVRELTDPALGEGQTGFIWQTRRSLVKALPGTQVLAKETGYYSPGPAYDANLAGKPVILRHEVGKGEAYYLVDDFSQGYYQAPFRTNRTILRNLLHRSPPPFVVSAPSQIIANAFWQEEGRKLVIHLLNLPPMSSRLFEKSQRDSLDDIVPVRDIRVTLNQALAVESVVLRPSQTELPLMTAENGGWSIMVPEVREHEMVVVHLRPRSQSLP